MLTGLPPMGSWRQGRFRPAFSHSDIRDAAAAFRHPVHVVRDPETGRVGVARGGATQAHGEGLPLLASLPPLFPEWLGDRSFNETHRTRFSYIASAMANGIATYFTQMRHAIAKDSI